MLALWVVSAICLWPSRAHAAQPRIVVLNSYHQGLKWSDEELTGLTTRIRQVFPEADLKIEHLDAKRFPRPEYLALIRHFLQDKYRAKDVDLVVVLDNPALELLRDSRQELFIGVPVIFAGVSDFRRETLPSQTKITGVAEVMEMAGTVRTILNIHPETSEILIITDQTISGQADAREMERVAAEFQGRLRFDYLAAVTFAEAVERIKKLRPGRAVGLILSFITDRSGQSLSLAESTRVLTANSPVPIYGLHTTRLGHGIVGGVLIGGREHGARAGDMALRVLAGEDPDRIPMDMTGGSLPMFDYRQLERFGISVSDLPADSQIVNRPESLLEKNKMLFVGLGGVILLLGLSVLVLSMAIIRQRRAERALRRSEIKHRQLLETLISGVQETDATGRFVYVNDSFARMQGQDPEEIIGKYAWDMMAPGADRDNLPGYFEYLVREKPQPRPYHGTNQRRDGTTYQVRVDWNYILGDDGQITGFTTVINDITASQRAERAVRESEERFRLAAQSVSDLIYERDIATDVLLFFGDIDGHQGYAPDEFPRTLEGWREHLHPEDLEMVVRAVTKSMETGQTFSFTYRLRRKDGGYTHWVDRGTFLRDAENVPIKVIGAATDITDRKKTQEEKASLEAQLRQAQKMEAIGTLAGGIAHDFNNVLAAIIGYTELTILDLTENTRARENLDNVLQAGHRAKTLVRQILNFSRRGELDMHSVEIQSIAKEAIKLLRSSLPSTIDIRTEFADEALAIQGDPTQIHQVLMNLCANAAHAMRDSGGILTFRLEPVELDRESARQIVDLTPGRHVCLTVGDTGHGMTPDILDRIFDPFFTTKSPGEGTGMGLAVVYGIVKSHQGAIKVYSEPGQGTTFRVYWPAISSHQEEQSGTEPIQPPRGRERILLVDDEPALAELGRAALEHLGYQVTSLTSSEETWGVFQERADEFDLLVTDQTMPHLTGLALAARIQSLRPGFPIVLCTGFSQQITEDRVRATGIRQVLLKPLVLRDLALAVRAVLDDGWMPPGQAVAGKSGVRNRL